MDQQQESMLVLVSRALKFATDHPYAATGIFGAAVGSAATYMALTSQAAKANGVFTPKVYELVLPREDVQKLLQDPTTELRWETPTMAVIVTTEKREPLKQLPVVDVE